MMKSTTSAAATALTIGAWFGRNKLLKIHCGNVWMPGPAVNDVTTISSNDRAKDSNAPAITAERTAGKVTKRKVCHVDAPRSIDASCNDRPVRRNRAATLLNTTTMQKVAWPVS